jgi:hypothetical protein
VKVTSWWLRCSACLGIAVALGDQGLRADRATGECEAELTGDGRGARGGEAQVILAGLLACVEELRPDEDGEVFRCAAVDSPGGAGSSAVATQGGGARAADEAGIGQRPWRRLVSGAATRGRARRRRWLSASVAARGGVPGWAGPTPVFSFFCFFCV